MGVSHWLGRVSPHIQIEATPESFLMSGAPWPEQIFRRAPAKPVGNNMKQELVETASSEWDGRFAERASRSATEPSETALSARMRAFAKARRQAGHHDDRAVAAVVEVWADETDAERASRSATEESLRAALDECRQHHADTLAGNERGQHRSATEGRREMSWIAEAIAANLEQAAPVKIEGGSPAREQWLSDVLAVQAAFQSADAGDTFVAAMNDNHSANSEERT